LAPEQAVFVSLDFCIFCLPELLHVFSTDLDMDDIVHVDIVTEVYDYIKPLI
jgi:hypothetical protein